MRGNRSRDTKPELLLRRALWAAGVRGYRVHRKGLPGSPDVTFGPARVAVFVDGCFWHGCPRCYKAPKTRSEFWRNKVETNRTRDARDAGLLEATDWLVLRVWECELTADVDAVVATVVRVVADRREATA